MFSVFLSSESLGELKKAVEIPTCGSCSHSKYRSPKLSFIFLELNVLYILTKDPSFAFYMILQRETLYDYFFFQN